MTEPVQIVENKSNKNILEPSHLNHGSELRKYSKREGGPKNSAMCTNIQYRTNPLIVFFKKQTRILMSTIRSG